MKTNEGAGMTGLELRKAALEVLGWHPCAESTHIDCPVWITPDGEIVSDPAIESDPAVSEPMFLEWCAERAFVWLMKGGDAGSAIDLCLNELMTGRETALVSGATPSEARARAIVTQNTTHPAITTSRG